MKPKTPPCTARWRLKLLSSTFSQNPVFRERLFREAHTAGRLREPHVLPIHSCGEIDGQVYIDMRLVRGQDLETLLKREGPLDPVRAVALIRQTAAALDAAHAEQVIHRDVKPANILLSGDDFASLVDFGLANAAGDARLTKPGKAVGTFDYVAPERLSNGLVDHRCDVYALAVRASTTQGSPVVRCLTKAALRARAWASSSPTSRGCRRPGVWRNPGLRRAGRDRTWRPRPERRPLEAARRRRGGCAHDGRRVPA